MDDTNKLIELAQQIDNFSDNKFDTFLKEFGYDEKDTEHRILMDDLFMFYSFWHFSKYKKIPHRNRFTEGSNIAKIYKLRMINPHRKGRLKWGIKCSTQFRIEFLKFKKENVQWQEKIKRTLAGRKGSVSARVRKKEEQQLEKLLSLRPSIPDSSQE